MRYCVWIDAKLYVVFMNSLLDIIENIFATQICTVFLWFIVVFWLEIEIQSFLLLLKGPCHTRHLHAQYWDKKILLQKKYIFNQYIFEQFFVVWKDFEMQIQYFDKKMSFYQNIVCENILCDMGLRFIFKPPGRSEYGYEKFVGRLEGFRNSGFGHAPRMGSNWHGWP